MGSTYDKSGFGMGPKLIPYGHIDSPLLGRCLILSNVIPENALTEILLVMAAMQRGVITGACEKTPILENFTYLGHCGALWGAAAPRPPAQFLGGLPSPRPPG